MKALLLLIAAISVVNAAFIPENSRVCDEKSVNECLKKRISHALKISGKGWPELKVPSLDPYAFRNFTIEYRNEMLVGKATVDGKLYGLSATKVHNVRSNLQEEFFQLEIDVSNPRIFVNGFYKGSQSVGIEPFLITTENSFNNTMTDLKWTWKIEGKSEIIDGEQYMRITKCFMRPKVGNMDFIQPDVFKDNPALSHLAQDYTRRNWKLIYNELLPVVELIFNEMGVSYANKIFLKVPYNEILPY